MDLLRAGRFIAHHRMQHPAMLGPDEVAAFLTTLATRDRVSASTQNQALSALLFLYANVIRQPLGALPSSSASARPLDCPSSSLATRCGGCSVSFRASRDWWRRSSMAAASGCSRRLASG